MWFLVVFGDCLLVGLFCFFVGLVVWVLGVVAEQFVARVYARGKVTIPLPVREVLNIEDGDYVRVSVVEVIRRSGRVRRRGRG